MNADPIALFVSLFAVAGIIFGAVLVCRGFAHLKSRRFVESMPASRIRLMALGPVEVGVALMVAPLPALAFFWQIGIS